MSDSSIESTDLGKVAEQFQRSARISWGLEIGGVLSLGFVLNSLLQALGVSVNVSTCSSVIFVLLILLLIYLRRGRVSPISHAEVFSALDSSLSLKERLITLEELSALKATQNREVQEILLRQIRGLSQEQINRIELPPRFSTLAIVLYLISALLYLILSFGRAVPPSLKSNFESSKIVEIAAEIREIAKNEHLSDQSRDSLIGVSHALEQLVSGESDVQEALQAIDAANQALETSGETQSDRPQRTSTLPTATPTATPTFTPKSETQSKSDESAEKGEGESESQDSKGDSGNQSGQDGAKEDASTKQRGEGGGEKNSSESSKSGEEKDGSDGAGSGKDDKSEDEGESGKGGEGSKEGGSQKGAGEQGESGKEKGGEQSQAKGGEKGSDSEGEGGEQKESGGKEQAKSALSKAQQKLKEMQSADGGKQGSGDGSGSSSPGEQSGAQPGQGGERSSQKQEGDKNPGDGGGEGKDAKTGSAAKGGGGDKLNEKSSSAEAGKSGGAPGSQSVAKRFGDGEGDWQGLGEGKGFGDVEIKGDEKGGDPRFLSDGESVAENKSPAKVKTERDNSKLEPPAMDPERAERVPLEYERFFRR